jgi:hypothetical protein
MTQVGNLANPPLGGNMNNFRYLLALLIVLALLGFGARIVSSQANPGASGTVEVHMVITDEAVQFATTPKLQSFVPKMYR